MNRTNHCVKSLTKNFTNPRRMLGLAICSNVRSANIKTNYKINFKKHPNPKHSKAPKVENQELNKQIYENWQFLQVKEKFKETHNKRTWGLKYHQPRVLSWVWVWLHQLKRSWIPHKCKSHDKLWEFHIRVSRSRVRRADCKSWSRKPNPWISKHI